MSYSVDKIDHVNIRIPVGAEVEAEGFWIGLLGFENVPKPPANAARGGRWFSRGSFEVHVSPAVDFQPATGAHIAFRVQGLDELIGQFVESGVEHTPNAGPTDHPTSYFAVDPFGNRLEFIGA